MRFGKDGAIVQTWYSSITESEGTKIRLNRPLIRLSLDLQNFILILCKHVWVG